MITSLCAFVTQATHVTIAIAVVSRQVSTCRGVVCFPLGNYACVSSPWKDLAGGVLVDLQNQSLCGALVDLERCARHTYFRSSVRECTYVGSIRSTLGYTIHAFAAAN